MVNMKKIKEEILTKGKLFHDFNAIITACTPSKMRNYVFSIIMMFNDDTNNDDYCTVDDGWCRDDNDVKDNCDSGCVHCGTNDDER